MMRLGFNIHAKIMGQEYSAAQKTYLATLLTRLNPSAILVMNNWDWALAYKHLIPKSIVVFRQYNKDVEGALWDNQSAKEYFVNTTNRHDPNIVLYIGNESQSYILKTEMQKAITWWVETIGLFRDANLPICLPNWGVGHPDLSWFTQDDKWQIMKPLIDAFKTHPGAYLGLHEYFSYMGVDIGNGRVGRHAEMAKALRARGYDMPPVLLTELGCDQIDDTGKRGFKHSMSDNAYASMLTECQRSTWNVDYIKGGMIYCFGSVTDEWSSFDVSDSLVLHGALVSANMSVGNPPPPSLDATVPSDLGNALAVRITGDNWYLRAEPTVNAAQIGKLMAGEEVKLYPSTATLADDQSYKVVKRIIPVAGEASTAWTAYPTPTNAPSVPDDNLNTIARLIVIRAKIHAMASLMEDVVKDIHQMELDIAASEAAKAAEIAAAA